MTNIYIIKNADIPERSQWAYQSVRLDVFVSDNAGMHVNPIKLFLRPFIRNPSTHKYDAVTLRFPRIFRSLHGFDGRRMKRQLAE